METIDPSRCAVVLGSSFLGVYAHAGFLNGLETNGFVPGRIAGASAGALAGALYAAGLRGDALRDAATDLALRWSFVDAGSVWRLPGVLTSLWSSGLFHGRKTVAHLRNLLGALDLSGLDVPLDIAVTNAATSVTEIRRDGPLAEWVMASCAVPLLFQVQEVDGGGFLDGGITSELPFGHLLDDPGIDTILLHRIRHERDAETRRLTAGRVIGLSRRTTCNDLRRLCEKLAAERGKRVVGMETVTPFPGLFRHRSAGRCYDLGFETGKRVGTEVC